jgi:ComF family protein
METTPSKGVLRGRWTSLAVASRRAANRCGRAGLNLLFPAECAGCGAETESGPIVPFCATCTATLPIAVDAVCLRCGAAVPGQVAQERCYLCRGARLWFDETIALGEYTGTLREWLLRMKDERGDPLALAVAELMWQRCGGRLEAVRPDVVVAVPMHWRRRWARGTNSPALLAERLSQRLRAPLATGLVRRTRHTPPQFSLPPSERPTNVRGAFAIRAGYHLADARVLVVDDILTTGSTCSAIARTLKQNGASHVAVAVIGRAGQH